MMESHSYSGSLGSGHWSAFTWRFWANALPSGLPVREFLGYPGLVSLGVLEVLETRTTWRNCLGGSYWGRSAFGKLDAIDWQRLACAKVSWSEIISWMASGMVWLAKGSFLGRCMSDYCTWVCNSIQWAIDQDVLGRESTICRAWNLTWWTVGEGLLIPY